MAFPSFAAGDILTAADMNAVGLWLVKTQAVGSGVSTVDVTSCFNSTYDNYRVTYSGGVGSTGLNINLQFLIGTTPTATNYNGGRGVINVGGAVWQLSGAADNNATSFGCGGATTGYAQLALDVYSPNLNTPTQATGMFVRIDNGQVGHCWTQQNANNQFTGFRLTTSTGTLTGGTIRVYGYRN